MNKLEGLELKTEGPPSGYEAESPVDVTRKEAKEVQGRKDWKTAGRYNRKTITLLPDMEDRIAELAEEEGVKILPFYRWLLAQGLIAYKNGERPGTIKKVKVVDLDGLDWR